MPKVEYFHTEFICDDTQQDVASHVLTVKMVFFLQMFIIAKPFLNLSANCNLSVFNALWSNITLHFPSICISVQWNGRPGLSQVLGSNPAPSLPEDDRRVASRTASGIKTCAKSVHTQLWSGGGRRVVATPWREV